MLEDACRSISVNSAASRSDCAAAFGMRHPAHRVVGAEDGVVPVQQSRETISSIYASAWLERIC
jgi:hypothetical protein